ncbi:hypothetical protein BKA82DRAFT_72895, partial [Pisolithus tinctorius]
MTEEHSHSSFSVTKLTSSNNNTWKGEMKAFLCTKGLWTIVNGSEKRPDESKTEAVQTTQLADRAAGELDLVLSSEQRTHVEAVFICLTVGLFEQAVQDDPVQIWHHMNSFNAWDDFFYIRKQPDESLSSLIARIEDSMSKIQELRPKDTSSPYTIKDLDNELVCMAMVRSLGEEYSHFASSLLLFQSLDKEELKEA